MQRVESELALQEREDKFKALFDAAPIGISINNSEGRFIQVNRSFQGMLGYTEDELRNITFREITFPDDLAESKKLFGELVAGQRETFRVEKRYVRKDGRVLWANTACSAVRDDHGKFRCTFAMVEDITERKQTEMALRSSEDQYRSLFENSIDAVLLATSEGIIGAANPEACRIFGRTEAEICAIGRGGLVDDSDPRLQVLLEERERTGRFRGELTFVRKDGTKFPGEVSSAFYKDKNGIVRACVMIRDITERKKTEQALHELVAGTATVTGEEFFPALVRHLAAALGVRYALVSECVNNSLERVRSLAFWYDDRWEGSIEYDLAGTTCEAVLREGKMCYYPDHIQELFPKERDALAAMRAVCYLGTPLFDVLGNSIGHIFIIDDKPLTDPERTKSILSIFAARAAMELQRIRAESHIREQATLLDKAHDAILVRGLDDRILYWNKSSEQLYGWKSEEVLGRNASELLFHGDSAQVGSAVATVHEKGEWNGELHQKTKDGREVIAESRWTLVRDNDGKAKSMLVINSDITEKKRLEAHFLRAQRMESIGTLAGGVAHDLNNVLTPIMLAVETLLSKPVDERTHHLLTMIESNAKRGGDMANQVLAFARGVEGERVMLEPRHLIKEIEKIARETFPRSIEIQTKIARGVGTVFGNATQLHQVLLNLCLNARDAMPNGGMLKIIAENVTLDENYARMYPEAKPGSFVLITVSDTGTGIPPEFISRVFEPFFTTKKRGEGTGLGLSTVAGIVKSHNGFVNVYSEVGKGSKFRVYIPAMLTAEQHLEEAKLELPTGSGELILMIDDEAAIREVTKSTLEAHGYNVLTAADGTEALILYAKQGDKIEVVLTDMMMPYMDGAATIRALEKMNPRVKIIASSGITANGHAAEITGSRKRAFISKPYTAEKLLRTLHDVLKRN